MGKFLTTTDWKAETLVDRVKTLTEKQAERIITVAEEALEEECGLDLETSAIPPAVDSPRDIPSRYRGTFDAYPDEETKFTLAAKRATVIIADQMARNPAEFQSQTVKSAGAVYGPRVPSDAFVIMRRWLRPNQIQR